MTQLTQLNKISIAELCFYIPSLAVASVLVARHGFSRSAGWLYLVIFSLMRIIGAAFQLATITQSANIGLYIGAQVLLGVGLSPLVLVTLGLVSRVLAAIPEGRRPFLPTALSMRIIQLIIVVGLILTIVGGINTGNQIADKVSSGTPVTSLTYTISDLTKAGMALMIAGYVLLTLAAAAVTLRIGAVPQGEKRLLLAVGLALPFVFVRLLFSILSTFDPSSPNFRQYGGGAHYDNYLLGMCTVMEMVAVVIFEGFGLSLACVPKQGRKPSDGSGAHTLTAYPDSSCQDAGLENGYRAVAKNKHSLQK